MARAHLQTPLIGVSLALLFIAGCSDNKSTGGVSLSKKASKECYSEYVDLHGDIKNAYKKQVSTSTGIASQSEYGKAHYEGTGANEGRALPVGCEEYLQISTSCYASYVDQNDDLLSAFNVSGQQDKSAWGKWHYETRPAADRRALPEGCTYLAAPENPCKGKGVDDVTDAQWNYFIAQTPALSGYTPKSAKHWYCTDAKGYGNASLTPPGQCPTGYTGTAPYCVEVVEEASSLSRCAGITSSTSKAAGVFTIKGNLSTAIDDWIANSTTATATYGDINTWNVTGVTDMQDLFEKKNTFNSDIGCWDMSNVTNLQGMFAHATAFNQDISDWNTSRVTNMIATFFSAAAFNQDIGNWNTGSVTTMNIMFDSATAFNQDLSSWTANPTGGCNNFAAGAAAWLAAYDNDIGTTPPIGTNMVTQGCGN